MSFSVPRWSRPIWGSTRLTISPSSSSTRRSTPCAAGCCGPKLMLNVRSSAAAASMVIASLAIRARLLLVAEAGDIGSTFPGGEEVEIAEFLHQLHRFVDDPLLFVVVTHFDITGQRKVLAQRITGE